MRVLAVGGERVAAGTDRHGKYLSGGFRLFCDLYGAEPEWLQWPEAVGCTEKKWPLNGENTRQKLVFTLSDQSKFTFYFRGQMKASHTEPAVLVAQIKLTVT